MQIFQTLSIQRKLVLIIMLTSGVALLLASVAFVVRDVIIYRHSMVSSLSSLTQVIGMNSEGALIFDDHYTAKNNLAALHAMPYVYSACIYDRNGEVFASYARADVDKNMPPPDHQESGHYFDKSGHNNYLFLFEPILSENKTIGTVFIQYDLAEMLSKMKEAGFIFVVIMLLTFFAAFMMSNRLQRIISDPILHLAQITKSISEKKDYSIRCAWYPQKKKPSFLEKLACHPQEKKYSLSEKRSWYQDEIGVLIDGFNEMVAEIQAQENELRQHRENELKRHEE